MEALGGTHDPRHSTIDALGQEASSAPAMLVVRAGRDDPEINATIDRFVPAAIARGLTLDLLTHPAGRHGFDILDPGERSSRIIQQTLDTLKARLGIQ